MQLRFNYPFKGDYRPVERISFYDALEFCQRLSNHFGKDYRLPSEAEWEYACRAGTKTPYYLGEKTSKGLVCYDCSYEEGTTEVGKFAANAFGLYDMHGNVWEWCLDHWHINYKGAPTDGSAWTESGSTRKRVLRGGSWIYVDPQICRSAYRSGFNLGDRLTQFGFRVCCSVPKTS